MLSSTYETMPLARGSHNANKYKPSSICMMSRMHAVVMSSSCSRRLRIGCFVSPTCNYEPSIKQRTVNRIRRSCRRQELACRIHNRSPMSPISNLQISNSLKISPSAPAHSARPLQNAHKADFPNFHFARHWPSQMQSEDATTAYFALIGCGCGKYRRSRPPPRMGRLKINENRSSWRKGRCGRSKGVETWESEH